jgi:hypothetical protein
MVPRCFGTVLSHSLCHSCPPLFCTTTSWSGISTMDDGAPLPRCPSLSPPSPPRDNLLWCKYHQHQTPTNCVPPSPFLRHSHLALGEHEDNEMMVPHCFGTVNYINPATGLPMCPPGALFRV